jgi:hypothetical protein
MTNQTAPNPQSRSTPTARTSRRRPSLYRTVLSLGIAAVVAAWLPFSMFYITALNKRVTNVSAISAPHSTTGTRVVTTASGATQLVAANSSTGATAGTPTPVTTRAS